MQNVVRRLALATASVLLISGCASKGWVRDFVGVRAGETDQHVAKVEEKVSEETQRTDRVEARITENAQRTEGLGTRLNSTETSLGEVRGLTSAAQEQADNALRKAEASDSRLTTLWSNRDKRTPVDTIQVSFGFDRWSLNDNAETSLVGLVKEIKENPKLSVTLMGYTDPIGPREYNLELSERRVEAVRRFLVEHDVELWRIHTVGLGPLPDKTIPNQQKRRVTVTLLVTE